LQTIAQLSAISSTINAAAVLCRNRVDRMGRSSMGHLLGAGGWGLGLGAGGWGLGTGVGFPGWHLPLPLAPSPQIPPPLHWLLSWIAGVTCIPCQAGITPARRLAPTARMKVPSNISGSRCAGWA